MLEHWELWQGRLGNTEAVEAASALREKFGDITAEDFQVQYETRSDTTSTDLIQFTSEALDILKEGRKLYDLRGRTLRDFITEGRLTTAATYSFKDHPALLDMPSIRTQVAFDPNNLFLTNLMPHGMGQLTSALGEYNQVLSRQIPDVVAVMGGVQTWIDLLFQDLDDTGKPLLRDSIFPTYYIVTSTPFPTLENYTVAISAISDRHGPRFHCFNNSWGFGGSEDYGSAAPLIMPKQALAKD